MTLRIGIHTGQQDCTYGELRRLWRLADDAAFYWISVEEFRPRPRSVNSRVSAQSPLKRCRTALKPSAETNPLRYRVRSAMVSMASECDCAPWGSPVDMSTAATH